jgi:hypothetical protein
MRHVRVIPSILDDDSLGPRPAIAYLASLDSETYALLLSLARKLYVYLDLHFTF